MTFTLLLVSGESQDFACEIKIDGDATFDQLHRAIAKALKYNDKEVASFFLCDEYFQRTTEIAMDEMFSGGQFEFLLMQDTKLKDVLKAKSQKFQYQFELLTQRCYFIDVLDMDDESLAKPKCLKLEGTIPAQGGNNDLDMDELLADADMLAMDAAAEDAALAAAEDAEEDVEDPAEAAAAEKEEKERAKQKKMTASARAKEKKKKLAEMSADDYLGSFEDELSSSDMSKGIYGFDDGDMSLDEGFHDMYDDY